MALIKRDNSKNWYYQFQLDGKRYFGSTGTQNKTKAALVEREIRNKAHSEKFLGESETVSVSAALDMYIAARKQIKFHDGMVAFRNKLHGFKINPRKQIKVPCYGIDVKMGLHELQTRDIERLVQKRRSEGSAQQTIKHEVGLLRATINEMGKLGYKINRDIVFPVLKTTYRLRYLDQSEELALLRELEPESVIARLSGEKRLSAEMARNIQDNYDLVVFLLDTGCRYSEVANIPWSAINMAENAISLYRSKVGNEDTLCMTSRLKEVLTRRANERRPDQRYVFVNRGGKERGYCTKGIKKAIDRAALNDPAVVKEKGGKVTLHTLRHSFASKLVRNGISLYEVSTLLGHSDPKMTQRYAHLAPNQASQKAVAVINALE